MPDNINSHPPPAGRLPVNQPLADQPENYHAIEARLAQMYRVEPDPRFTQILEQQLREKKRRGWLWNFFYEEDSWLKKAWTLSLGAAALAVIAGIFTLGILWILVIKSQQLAAQPATQAPLAAAPGANGLTQTPYAPQTVAPTSLPAGLLEDSVVVILADAETVNLRSGPGTDYAVLGQVQAGQQLSAIGQVVDSGWIQVEYPPAPDGIAYIFSELVEVRGGDLPEVAFVSPEASQPPIAEIPRSTATRAPDAAQPAVVSHSLLAELEDLAARFQESLPDSGWVHRTAHQTFSAGEALLPNGEPFPEDTWLDEWLFLDGQGSVTQVVSLLENADGSVLQVWASSGGNVQVFALAETALASSEGILPGENDFAQRAAEVLSEGGSLEKSKLRVDGRTIGDLYTADTGELRYDAAYDPGTGRLLSLHTYRVEAEALVLLSSLSIDSFEPANEPSEKVLGLLKQIKPGGSAGLDLSGLLVSPYGGGLSRLRADGTAKSLSGQTVESVSPDGRGGLYLHSGDVWIIDLRLGETSRLTQTDADKEWGAGWWRGRENTLLFNATPGQAGPGTRQKSYLGAVKLDGTGYRLLDAEHVSSYPPAGSPDGRWVAFGDSEQAWLYDWEKGETQPFLPEVYGLESLKGQRLGSPAWSPDGRYLAWAWSSLLNVGERSGVAVFDLQSQTHTLLLAADPGDQSPGLGDILWSPDSKQIAVSHISAADAKRVGIWIAHVISGKEQRLSSLEHGSPAAWSPDGSWLVLSGFKSPSTNLLWLVEVSKARLQAAALPFPGVEGILGWLEIKD